MRLRRSDFWLGDCYKRQAWREIKWVIRRDRVVSNFRNSDQIAWAMQRANARGLKAIVSRIGSLDFIIAVAAATGSTGHHGEIRNALLRTRMRKVFSQEAIDLLGIAARVYAI